MARNYKRDYEELPKFAEDFIGETAVACIEAYAAKRRIVEHRAATAFWNLVDDGQISVKEGASGISYIDGTATRKTVSSNEEGLILTSDEKRTVLAVFDELVKMKYEKVNSFLGTMTIMDMQRLHSKLKYEGYCLENGISIEDMTAEDYADAYAQGY